MNVNFKSIGTIHTPYLPSLPVPHQPLSNSSGEFWITLDPEYQMGLQSLSSYRYIYVLYYLDKPQSELSLLVTPPWAPEATVGLFASRSPHRPNPIGLSIVELKGIEGNEILISGIDVYNGTPLLDIKPYVKVLDSKPDSNDGWYDELPEKNHILAHLLNLPHDHSDSSHTHEHSHSHGNGNNHGHGHGHEHEHDHGNSHEHSHMNGHKHQHTHEQRNFTLKANTTLKENSGKRKLLKKDK